MPTLTFALGLPSGAALAALAGRVMVGTLVRDRDEAVRKAKAKGLALWRLRCDHLSRAMVDGSE